MPCFSAILCWTLELCISLWDWNQLGELKQLGLHFLKGISLAFKETFVFLLVTKLKNIFNDRKFIHFVSPPSFSPVWSLCPFPYTSLLSNWRLTLAFSKRSDVLFKQHSNRTAQVIKSKAISSLLIIQEYSVQYHPSLSDIMASSLLIISIIIIIIWRKK